jgi:hypothetical protein
MNTLATPNPASEWSDMLTAIVIGGMLLLGAILWVTLTGSTARAVYLGPVATLSDGIVLRTEPSAQYIIPDDERFAALRPGCRYDFNYAASRGAKGASTPRNRHVRAATLVDCPRADLVNRA